VKGSDGKHIGTVIGVDDDRVKVASGGTDHDVDIGMVYTIKDDTVLLSEEAEEAVRGWH
jgi:hypothetical protein